MSREVLILHAIRTYHATNRGILFDLSGVKADDYWGVMEFLRRYSFLTEKIQVKEPLSNKEKE
jgi:hypothetical protein